MQQSKTSLAKNVIQFFYKNSMTARPTVCKKTVKIFTKMKDLCLFLYAAIASLIVPNPEMS